MDPSINLPALDVPAILEKHHIHVRKRLGQNFLCDPECLEKIIEYAAIAPDDTVLEIGPGLGSLTQYLALKAKTVIAVELDSKLLPVLNIHLSSFSNVQVIQADILTVNLKSLPLEKGYFVIANIPYYITSAIIRTLLNSPVPPSRIVLTVQKEVAERICAEPGESNLLAISVQIFGKPEIKGIIPAESFFPVPQVDSAVIRIDVFPVPVIPPDQQSRFFRIVKAGFSQKRKTLRNCLSAGLSLGKDEISILMKQTGIDPDRRAQTLSIQEWISLLKQFEGI